jgi:hypothetical protein
MMYYFIHPEAYRMRPLDPLLVIFGCNAIVALRAYWVERPVAVEAPERPVLAEA